MTAIRNQAKGPFVLFFTMWLALPLAAAEPVPRLLERVRGVEREGEGHQQAREAVQQLSQLNAAQLPEVLAGMDGANPLAENWLRGAAQAIIDRSIRAQQPLPWKELEQFLNESQHNPKARGWVYQMIRQHDPDAIARLVPGWLDDPSLALRRDAVAALLQEAEAAAAAKQDDDAQEKYRRAFTAARDLEQIQKAAEALTARGETPDIARQMGFIQSWKLIGPFNNKDKKGFDSEYPPEKEIDLTKSLTGKSGSVKWIDHATSDPYGNVDLNTAVGKNMGAVAYAFHEFWAAEPQDVELRMGSPNANKIWLNGQLLTDNNVYHSNNFVDQYIGRGRLKRGRNEILVKILQNEQKEDWAQAWQFQLRVCDAIGSAVLSEDRDAEKSE